MEIISRLSVLWRKMLSSASPTVRSDGVYPGCSTLVDSHIKSSTPSLPIWESRFRSMISPSTGVVSSLKSPECRTVPAGVRMARQQESAMEWFTRMNSTVKFPTFTESPASTGTNSGV